VQFFNDVVDWFDLFPEEKEYSPRHIESYRYYEDYAASTIRLRKIKQLAYFSWVTPFKHAPIKVKEEIPPFNEEHEFKLLFKEGSFYHLD
jgi:hypothetical protein